LLIRSDWIRCVQVWPSKRDGVKHFGVGGIGSPADDALRFLQCVAHLRDQWSKLIGARGRPVQIEQRFRIPFCVQILIKQDTRSSGDVERREKALVEPFAANHVQRLFPDAGRAHGKQAEGWAIGQLFAFQKRSRRGSGRRNRGFGIAEFRLPLRGGKNGAAIVYEFEKVELLLTGQGRALRLRTRPSPWRRG